MAHTVVVGVEGTESSREALVWAAEMAAARKIELEIVCAIGLPVGDANLMYDDALDQATKAVLTAAADRALEVAPGLSVRTTTAQVTAAKALTDASSSADVLVIGSHPLSLSERVFAGSQTYQIVAGAHCPVLVVPQGSSATGSGVVVGVDGSPDSVGAVAAAAREADRMGEELTVVHAWHAPLQFMSVDIVTESDDEWIKESRQTVLAEAVAGLGERYPDLVVHRELVRQPPARALVAAGAGARLIVVGSRGRNGITRMLLGSVSHSVVLHAPCPVLVVRT